MRPDIGALAGLVTHWEEMNHLYVVENFLRSLMVKETNGNSYCELSAALMDNGDISVALVPTQSKYTDTCLQASEGIAKLVNDPPQELINSILRPVAASAYPVKPTVVGATDSTDGTSQQMVGVQMVEGSGDIEQPPLQVDSGTDPTDIPTDTQRVERSSELQEDSGTDPTGIPTGPTPTHPVHATFFGGTAVGIPDGKTPQRMQVGQQVEESSGDQPQEDGGTDSADIATGPTATPQMPETFLGGSDDDHLEKETVSESVNVKRHVIRPRNIFNPFDPMSGAQDTIDSVNSGTTNMATNTYNAAWRKVSEGTDRFEAANGASTLTRLSLVMILATAVAACFLQVLLWT